MKKLIASIVFILLLGVILFGTIDIVPTTQQNNEDIFTYSIPTIPIDLKQVTNLDKREQDIICATSKGLVGVDNNGTVMPALADSVEVKDNGIEYVFKIKSEIYWSNGTKILPTDIETFIKELLKEEDKNNIASVLNIYGAKEFRENPVANSERLGIKATEDTLIIRLNSKDDNFIKELSKPEYRIRKNLELWGNIDKNYSNIVYSGDYSIASLEDSSINLTKNIKAASNLNNKIKIVENEGEEVSMAAFEVGERDIVINPPKSQLSRLDKEKKLITLPSEDSVYLAFNPNSTKIPLEGRKTIYSYISESLGQYQLDNKLMLELAEGSYFSNEKEDLARLQTRKVMSMGESTWEGEKELVLIAEDTSENREMCEYIQKWFNDNKKTYIDYSLKTREEINSINDDTYYDMVLLNNDSKDMYTGVFYNKIMGFLTKDIRSNINGDITVSGGINGFITSEDTIFNSYQVLPLLFYNNNVATKGSFKNTILDGNGNINFGNIIKE